MHYRQLLENKRHQRRTIADAIEVLHELAGFSAADRAVICVALLRLPSAQIVGLIQVLFESISDNRSYVVSLPSSSQFIARVSGAEESEYFSNASLDGATIDGDCNVTLNDGTRLRAVEVVPARVPLQPTELDWSIVHCAVSTLGGNEGCYRSLGDGLPIHIQKMVPDVRIVDCSTLSGLRIPRFKILAGHIQARYPAKVRPSQQHIANALQKFGIRLAQSRPRKKRRASATI